MTWVSDHAVLRYLQRVKGIDVEGIRAQLAAAPIALAAEQGCDTILRHDCTMKLQGDVVSTVLPRRGKEPRPKLRPRYSGVTR